MDWLKKGIFAGSLLILFLVLLEIALRAVGACKTYTEKTQGRYISYYKQIVPTWYCQMNPYEQRGDTITYKNERERKNDTKEFHYLTIANSWGFRDAEFDTLADKNKKRFLVLGDSFVEGVGTPTDSTWPNLLQQNLQKDSLPIRIYNCGASGSDPFYEYVLLRDKLLPLKPNVVIMSLNASDLDDVIARGKFERFKADGTTQYKSAPWFEPYYKHCLVLRFFLHFVLQYNSIFLSPSKIKQESSLAIKSIANCVIKTDSFCKSNHSDFILVIHPFLNPLYPNIERRKELENMLALLPDSIKKINVFEPMLKHVDKSNYKQYAYPIDMHFKPKGYLWFSQLVADSIRTNYPQLLHPN